MLTRTLEVLRDILLYMPLTTKQLEKPNEEITRLKDNYFTDFKEYIDKIVVERKFIARFVANSGS